MSDTTTLLQHYLTAARKRTRPLIIVTSTN